MARQYLMGWQGAPQFRWRKTFDGKPYEVTCRELGAMVFTAEASYKAANAWWTAKLAELQGVPGRVDRFMDALLPDLEGRERERDVREREIQRGKIISGVIGKLAKIEGERGRLLTPEECRRAVALMPEVDALEPPVPVVVGKTVGQSLDSWLLLKRRKLKPKSIKEVITFVGEWKCLEGVLSADMAVKVIDEDKLHDVFTAVVGRVLGPVAQSKRWIRFREFVEWIAEMRWIELPRNVRSKQYKIDLPKRQPVVMTVATARDVLGKLPPRLRLYALLGLNCSCNNVDLGGLLKSQIDWTTGRVTRKRVKTEKVAGVPTVSFRLWPETLALLGTHLSKSTRYPEHALTSAVGTPLYTAVLRDGEPKITDLISQQWRDGQTGITFTQWRDLGSNLLYRDPAFRVLTGLYMGHAPASMQERHYIDPPPDTLDAALDYMHGVLFPGLPA